MIAFAVGRNGLTSLSGSSLAVECTLNFGDGFFERVV